MKITRIKPQKNKKRVNLYLDGQFSFGLDADNFLRAGLKVGQELSQKKIEELIFKNDFQKLLDKALRLISFRPRSEKEIRDYLRRKKTNLILIEKVIKKLKKLGQLNDQTFADWWREQRATFRPRGKMVLRLELRQKGVEKEMIEKVVSSINELKLAQKAAQKKARVLKKLPPKEFREKMAAFLSRRGFNWETIKETLQNFQKKSDT